MGEHTRSAQDQNDDLDRVEAALGGDEAAAAEIRSGQANAQIEAVLRNRGASPTEAADLTADLWADCFGERGGRRPLLEKFTGKGPLGAFLTRTALNRLIDFKRRQKFRGQLPGSDDPDAAGDAFDRLPGEQTEDDSEDRLVGMLREALTKAFANIDPEKLAIMKLVNVHGLEQGQVAKMWGWSQSKVSRNISAVMASIRDDTMAELKRMDPWLELHWEDFIALCKDSTSLFGDMDDAA